VVIVDDVRYAFIGFACDSDLVSQISTNPFGCTQARININCSDPPKGVWIMIRFSGGMAAIAHPPITGSTPIWKPDINLIS
jgi:hypothetical protein